MNTTFDLPYFPRVGLLRDVMRIYESGLKQGVTLFAPRRQGKTSFAKHELMPAAEELGWQTVYVDLWKRRSAPGLGLVESLEELVEQRHSGLRRRWITKQIKAKAKIPSVGVEATLEPVSLKAENVLENRLDVAFTSLIRGRKTLLILDEVQALAGTRSGDFVAALRTAMQKHQGHLVVFYTGSSREGLNKMFRQRKAPLFASTMAVQLPDLGDDFVEDRRVFLRERSRKVPTKAALAKAFEYLGRTPEFFNEIILYLILAGDGNLDAAVAAWEKSHASNRVDNDLAPLQPIDRAVLQLLATPGHSSVYSAGSLKAISQMMGATKPVTAGKVQTALKRLAKAELVAPTGSTGEYEIEDRALLIGLRSEMGIDPVLHEGP